MTERKSLSVKLRFEVFKRDSFTCQYCGNKAPEIILEVDHINPVAKGGKNEILNLITSCFSCNRGKSDRVLSDLSIVEKQRVQIEELNIRRQQLEMILQWKDGLTNIQDEIVKKAAKYICKKVDFSLNENGLSNLKKNIKKFGLQQTLDAFDISKEKYYKDDHDSFEICIKKIGGIAFLETQPEHLKKIAYAKGILNNRIYVNHAAAHQYMLTYYEYGYNLDDLITFCKVVRHWTEFVEWIKDIEPVEELPF